MKQGWIFLKSSRFISSATTALLLIQGSPLIDFRKVIVSSLTEELWIQKLQNNPLKFWRVSHCSLTSCGTCPRNIDQVSPTIPTARVALIPAGSMAPKTLYLSALKASCDPWIWRKCSHCCFVRYAFLDSPTVERKTFPIGNVSIGGIFYFDLWKRSTAAHLTFPFSNSPLAASRKPCRTRALSVQLRTSAGVLADRIFSRRKPKLLQHLRVPLSLLPLSLPSPSASLIHHKLRRPSSELHYTHIHLLYFFFIFFFRKKGVKRKFKSLFLFPWLQGTICSNSLDAIKESRFRSGQMNKCTQTERSGTAPPLCEILQTW